MKTKNIFIICAIAISIVIFKLTLFALDTNFISESLLLKLIGCIMLVAAIVYYAGFLRSKAAK